MIRITTYIFLLFCLLSTPLQAQISKGGTPVSNRTNLSLEVPELIMPSIDVAALEAEDKVDIANNNPLRFAFGHTTDLSLENSGKWEFLANGDRVWRLSIVCPDALNINFLYRDFFLPVGAELFIYDAEKIQVLGAFTSKNNKSNRKFATALIHSDRAILEYYEPAGVAGQGSINIAQVGHGYRPLNQSLSPEDTGSLGNSGDCQVNVNCEEGTNWQDQKKGVGKIVMDGLYLCSGNLINNTANDCKPYFLTANHCIMGGLLQDAIINPDVSGYVFYWNFEYHGCESTGFVSEQTTSGGTVIANSGLATTGTHTFTGSDFALIELDENPRDRYDVYFNGWDASGNQGNTGVGIHHPAGDAKKISTHSVSPTLNTYYWDLFWDATANGQSVTEGGSSGSSLFRETGHVIGQLFGGGSVNCDDPANDLAKYGRLDYSWTNADAPDSFDARRRLNDWLDPIGGGTIKVLDGTYNPCATRQVYFHQAESIIEEGNADTEDACISYKDYTYNIGITPFPLGSVTAEITASGTATEGINRDFEILNSTPEFGGPFNQQSFTVRVYDDVYPEGSENIELTFELTGESVAPMPALSSLTLNINDDDVMPVTHVQSVTAESEEAYLGPFGKVHYRVAEPGGLMMTLENLSTHDYGCTVAEIDNAGANANNAFTFGSTMRKTFRLSPEFSAEQAPLRITLYYTGSEVQGFETFNSVGASTEEVLMMSFADAVTVGNENSMTSVGTQKASHNDNDVSFTALISGIGNDALGLTVGALDSNNFGEGADERGDDLNTESGTRFSISPNPTSGQSYLQADVKTAERGTWRIFDAAGVQLGEQTLDLNKGINTYPVDFATYDAGVYFIILSTESGYRQSDRVVVF